MKILVTDDHAVVRQGYASLLSVLLSPCEVLESARGEDACQIYQQETSSMICVM